jgi:phosphate transport system permease protein
MSSTTEEIGRGPENRPASEPASQIAGTPVRLGDRIFRNLSAISGTFILVVMAAIAAFLLYRTVPALQANTANFFTTKVWFPDNTPAVFGIAALAWGTLLSSLIALVLAVPVSIGIALFIAHYAPRRMAAGLGYLVDLLAAVPSVIYGLWGLAWLVPHMVGISAWLDKYFGWIPIFHTDGSAYKNTMFNTGVVLAVMILPIISAVSREVFLQVPRTHIEAALAIGATRWEVMRLSVLPFGRSGVISASMLGLGRALGETVAVALVLSTSYEISGHILEPGGNTFAANIALQFGFAQTVGINALIASGLVLFIITLVVNMAARLIIARRRDFSGAD